MRQTASRFAAQQLKRLVSNVEVERKFYPGPKFASFFLDGDSTQLQNQQGQVLKSKKSLPFTAVRQPGQLIHDTYYDTGDDGLSKMLGVWVRQRHVSVLPDNASSILNDNEKGECNAKLRIGGNITDSQHVGIGGKENVSNELRRLTAEKAELKDLEVTADLQTRRFSWEVTHLIDGTPPAAKMTIVLDEVTETNPGEGEDRELPFRLSVGEVELFQQFVTEGVNDEEHERQRKEAATQRMNELEQFMLVNPKLFKTNPEPMTTLTAYEVWQAVRRLEKVD
ncbi:hypothetical protein GGS24DRAFT_510730 [Hypoxylon argillaceum]|nr:hypothetical protein GGS24DRAFT_510730 [Hypoxylon argillaceum]